MSPRSPTTLPYHFPIVQRTSLQNLDLSWCRNLSNEAVGLIVDSCPSQKILKLFGCTQITDVFLDGHSNDQQRYIIPDECMDWAMSTVHELWSGYKSRIKKTRCSSGEEGPGGAKKVAEANPGITIDIQSLCAIQPDNDNGMPMTCDNSL